MVNKSVQELAAVVNVGGRHAEMGTYLRCLIVLPGHSGTCRSDPEKPAIEN